MSTSGRSGGLERIIILTVSTLGGCCDLERTGFYIFTFWRECGGCERTDF